LGSRDTGRLVQVLIDRPARALDRPFTYLLPDELADVVEVGSYVVVPLGRQHVPGFVVGEAEAKPEAELRKVLELLAPEPAFGPSELKLAEWVAQRYAASLLDGLRCVVPPGVGRRAERVVRLVGGYRTEEALRQGLTARRLAVVRALEDAGGALSYEDLSQQVAGGLSSVLRALEQAGIIEREQALSGPQAREQWEQIVRLGQRLLWSPVLEQLGRRERKALEAVQTAGGAMPLRRLLLVPDIGRRTVERLAGDGLIVMERRRVQRDPLAERGTELAGTESGRPTLTEAQQGALTAIRAGATGAGPRQILLQGVTGSGKTEVYLRAVEEAVRSGCGAIILVPEIALTPLLTARFQQRFGRSLVLLHSGLSHGERLDAWMALRRGQAPVVVGARSAVFAPVQNLGLIVIDEEQEAAYKQEQAPRYDARAVARRRAASTGAVLVCGSATPAVETCHQAKEGPDWVVIELAERIDQRPMPEVEIVDLREAKRDEDPDFPLSEVLEERLRECLAADQQAILLLNRRGFSTFVLCRECGASLRCPDCNVALVFHYASKLMRCHHCGFQRPVPEVCDNCHGTNIAFLGLGTEKLEDQFRRKFPEARPARLDRDTTSRRGAYDRILTDFATGKTNVLLGTQMVAKGHDFPSVTLVGVVNADTGLNFPDFRAAERTFQLVTQAAGRAGRGDAPGQVIVQTYNPDHYALRWAGEQDYNAFYQEEIQQRKDFGYPPFTALINLTVSATRESEAQGLAEELVKKGTERLAEHEACEVLGPAPAPLSQLRGRYRWQVLLKGPDLGSVRALWEELASELSDRQRRRLTVDVDPIDMM